MTREIQRYELPVVMPGSQRFVTVFAYGDPEARPKVYLQAGLHGNEHPGLLVLHHLAARLDYLAATGRVTGRILVAPMVNPIGLSQFLNQELVGRFDFFGGRNFNRAFPRLVEDAATRLEGQLTGDGPADTVRVRKALTEACRALDAPDEADALRLLITRLAVDADVALDLHADGQSLLHVYAHPVRRTEAEELGARLGAPVVLLGFDPTAQSFDDALNLVWTGLAERFPDKNLAHGCFAATIEMRGRCDVEDDLAARDAENLLSFLMAHGAVTGEPGPPPAPAGPGPTPLDGVDHGRAPMAGLAVFHKRLGDMVSAGEVVAEVLDPTAANAASARRPVRARTSGLLFSVNLVRLVRAGQIFFKIAGTKPLIGPGESLLED